MFAAPDDDAAGRGRFIPDDYAAMTASAHGTAAAAENAESRAHDRFRSGCWIAYEARSWWKGYDDGGPAYSVALQEEYEQGLGLM